MEDLHKLQLDNLKLISKTATNLKKCSKSRLTKGYLQGRLQNLDSYWETFLKTHRDIVKESTPQQSVSHEYFTEEIYDQGEEAYLNVRGDIMELLEDDKHPLIQNPEGQSFIQQCQDVRLPKINIPQFNGNYNDWGTFKDLYTSLIHERSSLSPVQKLHYLKSSLTGEAEQLLKHISITDKNYEVAWDTLKRRYNNKRIIVNAILNRLWGQKKLNFGSAKGIKELLDTTIECLNSLKNNNVNVENWDPIIIHLLINKLDLESHKYWEESLKSLPVESLPTFTAFKEFLEGRFRVLEMIQVQTVQPTKEKPQIRAKTFHALTPARTTTEADQQCSFCKENHYIHNCKEFGKLEPEERSREVQVRGLCFNCLRPGHSVKHCRRTTSCLRCKKKHHTLLHTTKPYTTVPEPNEKPKAEPTTSSAPGMNFVSHFATQSHTTLLATALVNIMTTRGAQVVRALIDPCSQESFISEETARKLQLRQVSVIGQVTGVGKMSTPIKHAAEIQIVSRIENNYKLKCTAYVIKQVTEIMPVKKINNEHWTQLQGLQLADPTYNNPGTIDLLLGVNVYTDILMTGVIKGSPGSPIAQQTSLGWIISGGAPVEEYGKSGKIVSMHLSVNLDNMLQRFWESETIQTDNKNTLTPLEVRAESIYENTLARAEDGRFIVGLPFASDTPTLPEHSREIAVKRLQSLERKLANNNKLKEDYDNVIREYLTLKHMEPVDKPSENSKSVYLPHHPVIREDKETTKLRVVFDASCKGTNGVSLNDELLIGPSLQEELRDIIMRWRRHRVCFVADIVKMYRQIKVREKDTDYQRIVYRFNPHEEVQDFRLLTVTFGTASAPYLAIRTLKQLAKEERVKYPIASEIIDKDFYMDDVLTGFDDVKSAIAAHEQLQQVMTKGGFELQKWSSNSTEFMTTIQPEKRETSATLDMNRKNSIKALGIIWEMDKDNLKVTQKQMDPNSTETITKRTVLSQIASLFDPLGWLAPAIIVAKIFMQQLWLAKFDWDEELPHDVRDEWIRYQEDLPVLSEIEIDRWIGCSPDSLVELHGFSDASEVGYSAVVYTRTSYNDGSPCKMTLITAKTKVAPVKQLSLPRLELCAATLLSKLMKHVMAVLNIDLMQTYAWCDSKVVLAWIKGDPNRWVPFVKNRVIEIRNNLDTHWLYVNTKQNPADPASRGLSPSKLKENKLWWEGPEFLHRPDFSMPEDAIPETELEKRVTVKCAATLMETNNENLTLLKKYSSLKKLLGVVAYCRRWLKVLKKEKNFSNHVTCEEKDEALTICLKISQEIEFPEEITNLKKEKPIKKSSRLLPFTPYLDEKGLLRLGGRLKHADLSTEQKHPIIISKDNLLLPMLLNDAHINTLHGGPQLMSAYLRSKYWIIKGNPAIKTFYRKCFKCARYNVQNNNQLMGNLPEVRVKPSRPFLISGVDFAGPISCRMGKGRGAKTNKCYIALFVCMSTKAIHLELVSDMTTDAFIASFKRFVSRRGHCKELWSDHGTTFIAAEKELLKMWQQGRNEVPADLVTTLDDKGTRWRYIPPAAPNQGGLWEAGVKSSKYHLKRLLGESTLTFEEMYTVLTQIEACLNSRPLTPLGDDLDYLTPGHFLVGEPLICLSDRTDSQSKMSSLSRWQLTQRMVRDFWNKWQSEYLSRLQLRPKWQTRQQDLELGQLVLIKDARYPPATWKLGRVLKKYTGKDGLTRMYDLRTASGVIQRPITKLCRLPN